MNFAFNTAQTIWALTFAAQLVLLVVLLGRDRAKLYPVFTVSITLVAFRWLASRLLFQRLSPIAGNVAFVTLMVVVALANLALLTEVALKTFKNAPKNPKLIAAASVLAVALGVVVLWGPWPAWKTFTGGGIMPTLRMMQLVAQRCDMLTGVLAIELSILAAIVGSSVGAGWQSQKQRLLLGLGLVGASQITISAVWQYLATHTIPRSQDEYFQLLGMRDKLNNANSVVYILVLIWWIGCLWLDEKSATEALPAEAENSAVAAPVLQAPAVQAEDLPRIEG